MARVAFASSLRRAARSEPGRAGGRRRAARTRTRPERAGNRPSAAAAARPCRTARSRRRRDAPAPPGRRAAGSAATPRRRAGSQRPRPEVRLRLLRRKPLDAAFDPHLAAERLPVAEQRRVRIRRELAAFPALVAGEEGEAALVGALQQHHPRRRASVWRRGRERRRLRYLNGCGGVREPAPNWRSGSVSRSGMSNAPRLYGAQLRCSTMATTKTIDIRTAIPGPRSQAILERKQRVIANAKSIVLPIVAHEGRGATLTDVDATPSSTSPVASAVSIPATRIHVSSRPPPSSFALRRHRLHGRPVRAVRRAGRAAARAGALPRPGEGCVLQRRHRGGRERGQVRAPCDEAARRDRVRGSLPRPHAALDDADVVADPYKLGMGRWRRRSTGRRSRPTTAAPTPRRRWRSCGKCSRPRWRPSRRPRSSSSPSRARPVSCRRRGSRGPARHLRRATASA